MAGLILLIQLFNLFKNLKSYYHFDKTFDLKNKKIRYFVIMTIIAKIAQALVISILRK